MERFILTQCTWENLPEQVKQIVANSKDKWRAEVIQQSIKYQLRWKGNIIQTLIPNEKLYYEELIKIGFANGMVCNLMKFFRFLTTSPNMIDLSISYCRCSCKRVAFISNEILF